jgi:hypothetical protein
VAVGFDPDSMMLGANIIIGYVSSGTPTLRDDYGWQLTSHRDDQLLGGTRNVTVDGGTESAGTTEIMFTIPLNSGDSYDKVLVPGGSYPILLAMGPNGADDFSIQHIAVAVAQINLWELALSQDTWGGIKASIEHSSLTAWGGCPTGWPLLHFCRMTRRFHGVIVTSHPGESADVQGEFRSEPPSFEGR